MTLCDLKNLFVLPAQTICEEARKFPIDVIGQMIVQQGKYKGKTVAVAAQNSEYMKWVQTHTKSDDLKWCLLHVYKVKMESEPEPFQTKSIENRVSELEDAVFTESADKKKCAVM